MDTGLDEATPSPFLPPSPTTRGNHLAPPLTDPSQPNISNDVSMSDPLSHGHATTPKAPRPLSLSRSEGHIPISHAPLPTPGLSSSLRARLEAAAERNATLPNNNRGPLREPIDKYTCATMPDIHVAHPTAALAHIHFDLVTEWENCPGSKLIAIPFDVDVETINVQDIKGKIFTAAAEITQSHEIGVSAPRQSQEAERLDEVPISFLIYNLSETQYDLLLRRKVWSSTATTFCVTPLNPPCPDYLFTIKGFSILLPDDIRNMVHAVWKSEDVTAVMDTISEIFPEGARTEVKNSINNFLDSVKVTYLEYKTKGETLQPHFNVYALGSLIKSDDVWIYLRDYLAGCTYENPMQGQGSTIIAPFYCTLCNGVDHPRGLCPFLKIVGWNGPKNATKIRPSNANRCGRGGRARGTTTQGRR